MKMFCWILCGVLLNAAAQLLLKVAMNRMGDVMWSWQHIVSIGLQIVSNGYFCLGMLCYAISIVVWLFVLSRVEVSYAYPMLSMGYVVNAFFAYYVLHESMSTPKVGGLLLIMSGVFMMARAI